MRTDIIFQKALRSETLNRQEVLGLFTETSLVDMGRYAALLAERRLRHYVVYSQPQQQGTGQGEGESSLAASPPAFADHVFDPEQSLARNVDRLFDLAEEFQSCGSPSILRWHLAPDALIGPTTTQHVLVDYLRSLAVARLFFHQVEHIGVCWPSLGLDISQLALEFGASFLDDQAMSLDYQVDAKRPHTHSIDALMHLDSLITKTLRTGIPWQPSLKILVEPSEAPPLSTRSSAVLTDRPYQAPAQLLYKADRGEDLRLTDMLQLSEGLRLQDLASLSARHLAARYSQHNLLLRRHSGCELFGEGIDISLASLADPTSPYLSVHTIDWGQLPSLTGSMQEDWSLVLLRLKELQERHPAQEVACLGIRNLIQWAAKMNKSLSSLLSELKDVGVTRVDSSQVDHEQGLTLSERMNFHRQARACGLNSHFRVELACPVGGDMEPMWEDFVSQLESLRQLVGSGSIWDSGSSTHAADLGIEIYSPLDAPVSMIELLRGLSIARLVLPVETKISLCLQSFPFGDWGFTALWSHDLRIALAPILFLYGIDDFGILNPQNINLSALTDELKSIQAHHHLAKDRWDKDNEKRVAVDSGMGTDGC